jgi:hypothetical protein
VPPRCQLVDSPLTCARFAAAARAPYAPSIPCKDSMGVGRTAPRKVTQSQEKNHPCHQAQRRAERLDSTASRSPLQAGLCRLTCSAVSRALSLVRFARAACAGHEIARAIANAAAATNPPISTISGNRARPKKRRTKTSRPPLFRQTARNHWKISRVWWWRPSLSVHFYTILPGTLVATQVHHGYIISSRPRGRPDAGRL